MPKLPAVDPELMYETWLACNRNQTRAAEKLGITVSALNYHAKARNFDGRYAADYSGAAKSAMKMANVELMMEWPKLIEAMKEIVYDSSEKAHNRISAFNSLRAALPEIPLIDEEERIAYVDARVVSV